MTRKAKRTLALSIWLAIFLLLLPAAIRDNGWHSPITRAIGGTLFSLTCSGYGAFLLYGVL